MGLGVQSYRIRYSTSGNPDGNVTDVPLVTPLIYHDVNFDPVAVGPGPAVFPGVPADAYPVMKYKYDYTHPFGDHYLAYINTRALATGHMEIGDLTITIQGLDSTGAAVAAAVDSFTVRIDNVAPVPEIEPITDGASEGAGCGLIELADPHDTFDLTYRVDDAEGHLHSYHFKLFKCHSNRIGGGQYNPTYGAGYPLHWHGTVDDISGVVPTPPTWDGWVTVPMPLTGELFTDDEIEAGVNSVAVSIELWAISRTTDGRHAHLHWPRYVEVVGIKY